MGINEINQIDAMMIDLRAYRKSTGLKLREVEEATGLSNAYLSQLECGKIDNPSWKVVHKLFMFYNDIEDPKIIIPEYPQGDFHYCRLSNKGNKWICGYGNEYPMQHGDGVEFHLPIEFVNELTKQLDQ